MKTRIIRSCQLIFFSAFWGVSSLFAQNSEKSYVPSPENLQARQEFQLPLPLLRARQAAKERAKGFPLRGSCQPPKADD